MRRSHRHSHSRKKQDLSALKNRLRGQSRKITGPRAAILEILRRHPHPLTNKEILSEMQKGGEQCDLATIYRSMHLLEKMGMVKRFDFGDGAGRFELVGEPLRVLERPGGGYYPANWQTRGGSASEVFVA